MKSRNRTEETKAELMIGKNLWVRGDILYNENASQANTFLPLITIFTWSPMARSIKIYDLKQAKKVYRSGTKAGGQIGPPAADPAMVL